MVDNASVDGSVEMVRQLFPQVQLLVNQDNVGFGKANNQAFNLAKGDYIFVLNPDTIIREDTLRVLAGFMAEHPKCGACGCKILDPDGSFSPTSRRSFPTPEVSLYRILGLSKLFPKHPKFGQYNLTYLSENETTTVDALSGSCMFLRKETLEEVTGFDEQFFMYGEDLDLCFRIQQKGWDICYTPDTEIIHFKGESTKKSELKYVRIFYGAMVIFMEKHFSSRYSKIFTTLLKSAVWIRAALAALATFLRNHQRILLDFFLFLGCLILPEVVDKALGGGTKWQYSLKNAPIYACITIFLMQLFGGYPKSKEIRLLPIFYGWGIGFLCASSLPFFFKPLAYSRLFVMSGFLLGIVALCFKNIRQYIKQKDTRRALLVGNEAEFERLKNLLSSKESQFEAIGFLGTDKTAIGQFSQVRDAIRLHQVDDLVFAEASISNAAMFGLMQQVNDLAVSFRIFPKGRNHLLGQSALNDFSENPFIPVLAPPPNPSGYLHERIFALLWILAFPITLFSGLSTFKVAFDILRGQLGLIGCSVTQRQKLPKDWHVLPAYLAVLSDEIPQKNLIERYAAYYQRKNAVLDFEILVKHVAKALKHRKLAP